MSRKQIKKDFKELYIGQNTEELIRKYYLKKKKEMRILFIVGLILLLLLIVKEHQESKISDGNILFRNENGEGKKEVSLEVKTGEEQWQDFKFELEEREYQKIELEKMFLEAKDQLLQEILAENISIQKVTKDLNLIQDIEGFPFSLTWESSNSQLMDSLGHLELKEIPAEGKELELKVTFRYQQWEKEHNINVCIYPDSENNFITDLKETVKGLEKGSRTNAEFYLPGSFQKNTLRWRYKKGNTSLVLGMMFLIILPIIDYQKDQEIHKQTKKRREELQRKYPEFISKLILYMEAGMNTKGAFFRIGEEYQKKSKQGENSSYFYEELLYVCRQNRNGLSEEECYKLLGERCHLPCYKKLTGLLIQHLQKGSYGILEALKAEVNRAYEERKKQIKKQGEEMGTKLLLPMMLMLMVVMILIMVPACFSFQI